MNPTTSTGPVPAGLTTFAADKDALTGAIPAPGAPAGPVEQVSAADDLNTPAATVSTPPSALLPADAAQALPMPLHTLTRDEDDRARVTCDAPVGSACRLVCAEDCGAETWPCGDYDYERDAEREPHPMRDGGYCNVVEFLCDDPDGCVETGGETAFRSYSGPIKVTWEGDYYAWAPVANAPCSSDGSTS